MKKFKQKQNTNIENGITLIALAITIVVLLILAGITISALFGENSLIDSAKYSSDKVNEVTEDTTNKIKDISNDLSSVLSVEKWKDNGNGTFTFTKDSTTVKIGDYVNYDEGHFKYTPDTTKGAGTGYGDTEELATEDLTWRVLGVNEKGQLELISSDPTEQELYLYDAAGYLNAESNLNTFCN